MCYYVTCLQNRNLSYSLALIFQHTVANVGIKKSIRSCSMPLTEPILVSFRSTYVWRTVERTGWCHHITKLPSPV